MQLLPELNSGGVERGTLEMGRHLVDNGHKSIVVSGGGRLVAQLEKEGSYSYPKGNRLQKSSGPLLYLALRQMMKKNRVDIVHLRSRMPAWIGYLALKSLGKKNRPVLVTTFHGFYSVNRYSAIMTKGDGVIAVSKGIKQHIAEKYNRSNNVRLIVRGVDIASFTPGEVDQKRLEALADDWGIDHGETFSHAARETDQVERAGGLFEQSCSR